MSEDRKATLRRRLDMPFVGFVPWIVLSVVEGPHRLLLASVLALAMALLIAVAGVAVDLRPKLLDVTGIAFFGVLTVVVAVVGGGARHWLGIWAGEISNAAIALITLGSILARQPFTIQYARETTEREYWNTPLFLRINYAISGVWAIAFLITAIVGYIGDGPLHQPNNVWTNWIVQIALIVLAIKFTAWYPDHATAVQDAHQDDRAARVHRPLIEMLRPLAAYLVPAGVVVLFIGGSPWWIGAALIVLGVVVSRYLHAARQNAVAPSVTGRDPS